MAFEFAVKTRSRPATIHSMRDTGCADLHDRYHAVRSCTEELCTPLEREDHVIQSMPEASPVKWHLAHMTWFFETFILTQYFSGYRPFHSGYSYLFNSYYETVGPRTPRPQRGLLSRPTVDEIFEYRAQVDEQINMFLERARPEVLADAAPIFELGLNHEQQHQELILTDLKHAWSLNPLHPVYCDATDDEPGGLSKPTWATFPGGLLEIGHDGAGFAFDNEAPRHRVLVNAYQLGSHLPTNADYLAFLADGGYDRPELWLSDGWAMRQTRGWTAPLYWERLDGKWFTWSLAGLVPLEPADPVCHLSYYEADAFARWAGARLPTEAEWEAAASAQPIAGQFQERRRFHPGAAAAPDDQGPLYQLFGDVWQWTCSPYVGYPGYRPAAGALGEYNGKFMCNQLVLRGASCATPRSHARVTYRNFFPPEARWQFTGIRLARDLS